MRKSISVVDPDPQSDPHYLADPDPYRKGENGSG